jgi:hypothetical protein
MASLACAAGGFIQVLEVLAFFLFELGFVVVTVGAFGYGNRTFICLMGVLQLDVGHQGGRGKKKDSGNQQSGDFFHGKPH